MKNLSKIILISSLVVMAGCASLKEISNEYPILTHVVVSNAVTQRIKLAENPADKAALYMAGVSRLRAAGGGSIPYSTLGEFVRDRLGYSSTDPATRKLIDDSLLLIKLVLDKELKKRGLSEIPADYPIELGAYLDAIEAGARVYLPQ